jgi:hypothetical protein
MEPTGLIESGGLLFALQDVTFTPETPQMKDPFTVKGKVNLLKIPFMAPLWIIAVVTYPEEWWEELIPIWGSPEVRASDVALGGDFTIEFPRGFEREGEFKLDVYLYGGPTYALDSITLPPIPALASAKTTFIVAGEAPPQEDQFRNFQIVSYSKNGGTPVQAPGVLQLKTGDRCRVNTTFDHKGPSVSGKIYAAIWKRGIFDTIDEILKAETGLAVPQATDWTGFEKSLDIIITSAIQPGSAYGLYSKIIGITGGDVFSPYLENVITITGVGQPTFTDLQIVTYTTPVEAGETCTVKVRFTYQGPSISRSLYAAIGNKHTGYFDEILYGSRTVSVPNTETPTQYEAEVGIAITSSISPGGSPYDVYAKINGATPYIISPILENVITVTGAPAEPSFSNLQITGYETPVEAGDRCRLSVQFTYQGPAVTRTLYGAIGNQGAYFDEILYGTRSISIPRSDTAQSYSSWVEISITSAIDPDGSPYDIYTKINGATPAIISPVLRNVITVTGAPSGPSFRNVKVIYVDSPVRVGDTCYIGVEFEYATYSSMYKTLYASIGKQGWLGFDEILYGSKELYLTPTSGSWRLAQAFIQIVITSKVSPSGSPYDVYAKLDSLISPILENAVEVRS